MAAEPSDTTSPFDWDNCIHVRQGLRKTCHCDSAWDNAFDKETFDQMEYQPAGAAEPTYIKIPPSESKMYEAMIQEFVRTKKSMRDRKCELQKHSPQNYTPLLDGEIRVLELEPGQSSAPFRGRLHVANVDFAYSSIVTPGPGLPSYSRITNHAVSMITEKPIWYTALSYVWGEPVFDETINLDHGPINITSSLAAAMRYLRSTESSVFLWVDQICIDQSSNSDKERQIPLMGSVYSHSTNTLIWMGDDPTGNPAIAFKLLECVYIRLQGSDVKVTPDDFARLRFPPEYDSSWNALRQFFRNPWFSRTWVIQECILPNGYSLFVRYGSAVADWETIAVCCLYFESSRLLKWLLESDGLEKAHLPSANGCQVINALHSDRSRFSGFGARPRLLEILASTRYAQATNPKDKIYGVLGVVDSNIVPDYSDHLSAREVYHQATLTQLPDLMYKVLSCVDHEVPIRPSWTPDWGSPRATESLGYFTKVRKLYRAGTGRDSGYNYQVQLDDTKERVTLKGKVFDEVFVMGSVCVDPALNIINPKAGNKDIMEYCELARRNPIESYPDGKTSIYDAFWQTLVSGRDGTGSAPPSQEHSQIFSLILDETTGRMPSLPGQVYSARRKKGHFTLENLKSRRPAQTLEDLNKAFAVAMKMRRFAVTRKGYFALIPRGALAGDLIVVLDKACVPFVLRPVDTAFDGPRSYELLGEAYVHGIMGGEMMNMGDILLQNIVLV